MDLFKLIAEYIGNGYIVHGTNLDIDMFDSSFIKGGFRAGEGYGFYFTSRPSKALDYGTKFYAVKADEFNFVSTNANPTEVFKDVINAEDDLQWLRNKQSEVRNNRDYDMYETEINKTNDFYKSIVCDSITEHIIDIIKWKKPSSMRELWYSHVPSNYIPFIADMLLKLGYDGYREDDIYTIFNVKKLNEKFIRIDTVESVNEDKKSLDGENKYTFYTGVITILRSVMRDDKINEYEAKAVCGTLNLYDVPGISIFVRGVKLYNKQMVRNLFARNRERINHILSDLRPKPKDDYERKEPGFTIPKRDFPPREPSEMEKASLELLRNDEVFYDVNEGRRYFGGNSGYVGYSKSRRAVDAESRGLRNKSQIGREFAEEVNNLIKQNNGSVKVSVARIKRELPNITPDEWHHTSMYGNRTNYYSPETVAEYFNDYVSPEQIAFEEYVKEKDLLRSEYLKIQSEIDDFLVKNIVNVNTDLGNAYKTGNDCLVEIFRNHEYPYTRVYNERGAMHDEWSDWFVDKWTAEPKNEQLLNDALAEANAKRDEILRNLPNELVRKQDIINLKFQELEKKNPNSLYNRKINENNYIYNKKYNNMTKKTVRLTESGLHRLISESVKKVIAQSAKRILKESSDTDEQWKSELKAFMDGLRRGNYDVSGDTVYVEIWKSRTAENDPRYVYYKRGGNRLYDDHFYMQQSPRLSRRTINAINKRLGWNSYDDEYDNEY